MEKTVRLSLTIPADKVAAFSRLLDNNVDDGNIISWGERVRKGSTTFFITFPNALTVWNLSALWVEYTQTVEA